MRRSLTYYQAAPILLLAVACSDSSSAPAADTAEGGETATAQGATAQGEDTSSAASPRTDAGAEKLDARVAAMADASAAAARADAGSAAGHDAASALGSDASAVTGHDSGTLQSDAGAPAQDADSGPATPTQPSGLKPKCVKKASQVMIVGDSYINWITHTFGDDMAQQAGGQRWRMEAVGGYSMGSGGIGFIPTEYDDSIAKDPDCHTILMDGGGNDVLVADPDIDPNRDCLTPQSPMLPQCQTIIDKAIGAADGLLKKASAAGIRDVVYFFYPHVPTGTLLGGESPNAILDFASPQVRKFCEGVEAKTNGKTRCTFVDMVPVFQGHDDWFVDGDIHENSLGSAAMAKKIWSVMKDKCIAQPASAGCCEE